MPAQDRGADSNPAPCNDLQQPAPFLQIVEQVRPDRAQCLRPPLLRVSLRDLAQNPRFHGHAPDLAFQLLDPAFPLARETIAGDIVPAGYDDTCPRALGSVNATIDATPLRPRQSTCRRDRLPDDEQLPPHGIDY